MLNPATCVVLRAVSSRLLTLRPAHVIGLRRVQRRAEQSNTRSDQTRGTPAAIIQIAAAQWHRGCGASHRAWLVQTRSPMLCYCAVDPAKEPCFRNANTAISCSDHVDNPDA
jgi:hypothetical protein